MLYINNRLFILNVSKLRIHIIREIYNILLKDYVERFLTYSYLSIYYF